MPSKNIGVIGLGAMGGGMARALRRQGFGVHVFDVQSQRMRDFVEDGGMACGSAAELAARVQVMLLALVNAQQIEQLLFGPQGAAAALAPGSCVIMSATVAPQYSVDLDTRLAQCGVLYVDAPVSGGAAKAESGALTVLSSGSDRAYALANPVLEAVAAKVYRLGSRAGIGSQFKTINQLLAGVHIAAAAEAMALGMHHGLEPQLLYEVITHSAGNSWMFENRMAHVLAGDYAPQSALSLFVKDLGLVLDSVRESPFPLPLAAAAHQLFMQAAATGHGQQDDSAVIKVFPGQGGAKASAR